MFFLEGGAAYSKPFFNAARWGRPFKVARKLANIGMAAWPHGPNTCSRLASHPGSISIISVWHRVFTDAFFVNSFVICILLGSHHLRQSFALSPAHNTYCKSDDSRAALASELVIKFRCSLFAFLNRVCSLHLVLPFHPSRSI